MGWTERTMFKGYYHPIKDLVALGFHTIEIWGCAADGWQAYLVRGNSGLPIGPLFHRDFGDTMKSLRDAIRRAYGAEAKKGRHWL